MHDSPITLIAATRLPADARRVFDFHADVRNLPRLTPGPARILSASSPTREDDIQVIEIGIPPLAMRWRARIARIEPPRQIVDVQEQGPFRFWRHTHAVIPADGDAVLVDIVEFRLLPGAFGRLIDGTVVAAALRALFVVRHARTRRMLASWRPAR
jgi:ligand-binding SRPBCC domain-containing protein